MFTIYDVSGGEIFALLQSLQAMSDTTAQAYRQYCRRWGGNECVFDGCKVVGLVFSRNSLPSDWRHLGGNVAIPAVDSIAQLELDSIAPHYSPGALYQALGLPGVGAAYAEYMAPSCYRLYLANSVYLPVTPDNHYRLIGRSVHLPISRLAA
ncbi:hypothetical protein [Shewanella xiamenensis]|uniref:hypothetical protein n=1 Tax=Shewanella xiamenensis TaxID=332186 RepID=UPI000849764C|nr:hypothetical protein [Shewanella xiamenensis]ODR86724.1 hypothetical protein ABT47_16140 [Shewanella xiamenensis]